MEINTNYKEGDTYLHSENSQNLLSSNQLLYKLKEDNIDSFLALNIMDTDENMLEEMKFTKDSNEFNYFLFKNKLNIQVRYSFFILLYLQFQIKRYLVLSSSGWKEKKRLLSGL